MAAWRSARCYHTSCKGKPTGSQSAELNAQSPNRPPNLAKSLCKVTPVLSALIFISKSWLLRALLLNDRRRSISCNPRVKLFVPFDDGFTALYAYHLKVDKANCNRTNKSEQCKSKDEIYGSQFRHPPRSSDVVGKWEKGGVYLCGPGECTLRHPELSCVLRLPNTFPGMASRCLCCAERYSCRRVSLHVAKMAWPVVRAAIKLPYRSRLSTAQGLHGMKRKNSNSGGLA